MRAVGAVGGVRDAKSKETTRNRKDEGVIELQYGLQE